MPNKCEHKGYVMRDGDLVCKQCGEPSPSKKWRTNVYGIEAAEAQPKETSDEPART